MATQSHYCPQCGHIGPPARRLSLFGWLLLPVGTITATFGLTLAQDVLAQMAVPVTPGFSLSVQLACIAAGALPVLLAMLITRRPVCAACGWRHTRPATNEDMPGSAVAPGSDDMPA